MKKLIILTGLILAACQSCHPIIGPFPEPAPQPEPPSPWPDPLDPTDATADASPAGDSCAAACARGAQLGCKWSAPTPKGASCVDVCENTKGSPVSMQADCVARATTCADADACGAIPNGASAK